MQQQCDNPAFCSILEVLNPVLILKLTNKAKVLQAEKKAAEAAKKAEGNFVNGGGGGGGGKPPAPPPKPDGIPDDWIAKPSDKNGGTWYINPNNTHDRVRVMPGNPNSPYPSQQQPYIIRQNNGKYYDANGKEVSLQTPDAHIPYNQFKF